MVLFVFYFLFITILQISGKPTNSKSNMKLPTHCKTITKAKQSGTILRKLTLYKKKYNILFAYRVQDISYSEEVNCCKRICFIYVLIAVEVYCTFFHMHTQRIPLESHLSHFTCISIPVMEKAVFNEKVNWRWTPCIL